MDKTFFFCVCTSIIIFLLSHQTSAAQHSGIQDPFTGYERALHTIGLLPVHNVTNQPFMHNYINRVDTLTVHPWNDIYKPAEFIYTSENFRLGFYDPEQVTFWRNRRPGGINNGAVWQGRGVTSSFSAGIFFRYRFLSASVRPLLIYNQNQSFSLSRYQVRAWRSQFSNPLYNIDTPQRFGDSSFITIDPGPSYVRVNYKGFEAGLSNQNRWWGPALHYPVVMSNNAPGFWHFFAGTHEPKDIYIGNLEVTVIWGRLLESDYFDRQSFNDERYITGFTLAFNPGWVPNLTVGLNRVFYRTLPPEGIPPGDLLRVFDAFTKNRFVSADNLSGNDLFSQMLSFFGRWVFPESGFEIYGEWARNDHSWNLRDALGQPEHSRAYVAGLQKTYILPNNNMLAVNAEIVQLELTNTRNLRSDASIYTHHIIAQGYTHRGQVLGAGIGPGSNSQLLNGKYYFTSGKLSGWLRRTVYNNDFLYRSNSMLNEPENLDMPKFWLHNFEIAAGTSLVYFFNRWETEASLELAREYNNDFIYNNDLIHVAVHLRMRYRLSALR